MATGRHSSRRPPPLCVLDSIPQFFRSKLLDFPACLLASETNSNAGSLRYGHSRHRNLIMLYNPWPNSARFTGREACTA